MTGYNKQYLFFKPVPDLEKLYSVFLSFHSFLSQGDEGELRNSQVKTCRELLHTHSDVIASPVFGSYGGIRVIMSISSPQKVLPSILQMCLSYSLTARLAPNWNRVGQYFIAGKDFLSDANKRFAVGRFMELSVTETELCVSVEASTIRLPPVTLKDFDVPALVMERFLNKKETVLHTKAPNNWVYILPSMKKGQVISISRTLPPECPFQTYAELQNHWTIMPVQCFPRVNLQAALRAFITDVRSLIEKVCGFTAQLTSQPLYHTPHLSRPSIQDSRALPANLTFKCSSRLVLTQNPSVCTPEMVPLSKLASSPWRLSQPVGLSNIQQSAATTGHWNPQIPSPILQSSQCNGTETSQFSSSFTSLPSFSSTLSVSPKHPVLSNTQPVVQRPKLVPIFRNKSLSRHVNVTKILAEKKKQQEEAAAQCALKAPLKRFSSSPLSCASSLPRVSLPFFKDRKKEHSVCTTTPVQPVFKKQPAPMPEIKTGGEVFQSHPKKAKLNIQEVDVVKYARINQLAKINVATLQAWLKGQGIPVCSKDKKGDLMSKVMHRLNEP
ncbi:hypothetical protein C0J45_4254 [Silurus meridionalis]|nr:hypothetical protein C0J45_4254 [Silurus meridionalis]